MRLWEIKRHSGFRSGVYDGFIVTANTEEEAWEMISPSAPWPVPGSMLSNEDTKNFTCTEVKVKGNRPVLLYADFAD